MVPLDLRYPSGVAYESTYTQPWEMRKFLIQNPGQPPVEFVVGGSMSPTNGHAEALWPDDNINRRIFLFHHSTGGSWVRDETPIVGKVENNWIGHSTAAISSSRARAT